jgi:hypothetical protein
MFNSFVLVLMVKCFLLSIILSITSCGSRSNFGVVKSIASDRKIESRMTEKQINSVHTSLDLIDFTVIKEEPFLLTFNRTTGFLEILHLGNSKSIFNKNILSFLGDIEVNGEVNSIEFVNFDSIFILQKSKLSLMDTAKVIWQKEINGVDDPNAAKILLMNMNHAPMYYDRGSNSLSIQSYCHTCYFYEEAYYKTPLSVSLSLVDYAVTQHNLFFPGRYLKKYYGFHNLVFRNEYADRILLSFSAEPNVFVYHKESGSIEIVGGRSKNQERDISPLSKKHKKNSNKKLQHLTLEPIYMDFLYDEYRNLYYRFLLSGVEEKRADGTFSVWADKELILMVFDSELKLIAELNLGSGNYNSAKSFVAPDGIYLYNFKKKSNNQDQNEFYYDILEIE